MCDKVARERWCVAKKGPFCTKQTKDINVRCNRLYSSLHTQVSHAASTHALKGVNNIISKQKRLDNIARPKLLRAPCWRKYFFTATHDSLHIVSNHLLYHIQKHTSIFHGIKRFFTHCVKCTILKDIYNHISNIQTETYIFCVYIYILPSRNVGHRHKNDATLIQQVPGSNASNMQRKWSCKETCRNMQASFAQSCLL